MMTIAEMLTQLDMQCDKITHQHVTIEAEIRESSKRLHEVIDSRQDKLLNHLAWITRRKLKLLANTEGSDRDPSGSVKQLLRVYEGEPQDRLSAS